MLNNQGLTQHYLDILIKGVAGFHFLDFVLISSCYVRQDSKGEDELCGAILTDSPNKNAMFRPLQSKY